MAIAHLARGAAILSLAFVSACVSTPEQHDWPYPEPPESGGWDQQNNDPRYPNQRDDDYQSPYGSSDNANTGAEPPPASSSHPTVVALVQQAQQERTAGNLDKAAATLERAIRIVNDDPLPWLKLAEIRFEQSNFIQAENLARRSISFASRGPTARQAWLLIADIKRLQGDDAGARQAETKARDSQ